MFDVSLNLIVLRSPEPERLARFYSLLGIRFEREQHGDGPEHLAAHLGEMVFEIYPRSGEPDAAAVRLGFRVPSVAAVVDTIRRQGGTVVSSPSHTPWGYRAVVADPDGRRVEINETGSSAS